MALEKNKIYCGDNLELIKQLDDNCIDLTVTSPPYDNLRTYNGYSWDFEGLAKELFRVTKDGGVVVWVVGDATIDGSETGTSFRQALYFMECGFNLHDTMIYLKDQLAFPSNNRYHQAFEYMFILSKGTIKSFNPIKDRKNKNYGHNINNLKSRCKTGETKENKREIVIREYSERFNYWLIYNLQRGIESDHPATYPEALANDHIISWSNKGDLVLDPFLGSGTTAKMALKNERDFIGFELSQEYCDIAEKRIAQWKEQERIDQWF